LNRREAPSVDERRLLIEAAVLVFTT